MHRSGFLLVSLAACVLPVVLSCGSEGPTTSDVTITAPSVREPATGTSVGSSTPILTVGNATGASGLRYRFEVSRDSTFASTIAVGDDLPEGGTGTTSWTVATALDPGTTYHWRARASASGVTGPYSSPASFDVLAGFISQTPEDLVYVFDPLTTGTSVGRVSGGDFRDDGWMATNAVSYIRYDIPTTPNGFVEFQVTNLRDPNPHSDKRSLICMWDPTKGDITANPYRVNISKFDTNLVDRWHMRLRFISNGHETNTGIDFYQWDPRKVYTFRMEWGAFPNLPSQRVRVMMDGTEILTRNYDPLYRPTTHRVELGMAERAESLEEAVYSNVTIGIRQP